MQICYAIENKLFMYSGLCLFDAKLVGVVCVSVVACIAQQN